MMVLCIFVNHSQIISKQWLSVRGPNELPEIDPLGCFKTKQLFAGFA